MTEKEWMNEGIDLKLILLLYRKKIWIVIAGALAGAAFAAGLYFLVHVVYAPEREYEAVSKLYLTFAEDDDGDAYQYYNGYTWNDLIKTEPILDKVIKELSASSRQFPREEVKEKITADILSDIRLLTITVRTNQVSETEEIIRALENALTVFGGEMPEFDRIEVIEHGSAELVVIEDETLRAAAAGFVIGFLFSLLGLAFVRIMDDSVYVPSDFEKRYAYPVLGVKFAGNEQLGRDELDARMQRIKEKSGEIQFIGTTSFPEAFATLKAVSGEKKNVVLEIPYGKGNGKLVGRCMAEAKFWQIEIMGAVITEADEKLYRMYFAAWNQKKRKQG